MPDGDIALRVPPHSVEAEQSVLGSLLLDNTAWDRVGELAEADFYKHDHRLIWCALGELINADREADVITVFERLQGQGKHDDAGGLQYLNALAQSVPSAANVAAYARIVRQRALRRRAIVIADALAAEAYKPEPGGMAIDALADRAAADLLALQQHADGGEPQPMSAVLVQWLDDLQARADGNVLTFPTGLADIDRLTGGGGRRGELWVIGARPSMGKTAFTLQLCRRTGERHQVLLCSQEDSLLSSSSRFVASAAAMNLSKLRSPRSDDNEMWTGVTLAVDELQVLDIALDEETGLGLGDIRRKALQVKRRTGRIDLIVVDYLQLMDDEDGENRTQVLGNIAFGLKRLAKQLDAWVVLLSQLSRKADDRSGPPQMSDLRDSGNIEEAADLVGLLYREHMRKPTEDNKYWAQLHVCKQKNGPTDTVSLHFDGSIQRFGNWDGPPPRRARGGGDGA